MSRMVTRGLQRQLDKVVDRNEQVPTRMQEDVCSKKVASIPNNVHHVNPMIPRTKNNLQGK